MKTDWNTSQHCAFTGHRPECLAFPERQVIQWLEEQIRQAVNDGCMGFITGMLRSVDIGAAEAVPRLGAAGKPSRLIAASAFCGMEDQWDGGWQARYLRILSSSYEVFTIGNKPGRTALIARDHWMVDHASRLIAVCSGAPGGTKETVEYAESKGCKQFPLFEGAPADYSEKRGIFQIFVTQRRYPAIFSAMRRNSLQKCRTRFRKEPCSDFAVLPV